MLTIVVRVLLVPLRRGGAKTCLHVGDVFVQQRENRLWLRFPELLLQSEGLDGQCGGTLVFTVTHNGWGRVSRAGQSTLHTHTHRCTEHRVKKWIMKNNLPFKAQKSGENEQTSEEILATPLVYNKPKTPQPPSVLH